VSTGQLVAGAGFISSLQINTLSFGPSGYVIVGDVIANSLSTTRLNTQALYTNNLYVGNVSSQSAILFPGIDGTYKGTAVAERTTGTGTSELLLYKVSSTTDQIRLQTTGNMVFEVGAPSRSWNSTTQLATPTLYIAGSTSNVGVGTAAPAATLDVVGTGRFQTLSSFALNVSTINGIVPAAAFNGSIIQLSTGSITASNVTMSGALNMNTNPISNAGTITESTYISNMVAWFDGNDSTTLFQDGGGTSPVTANNQNVYLWKDKSPYKTNATPYVGIPKSSYASQGSKNGVSFNANSGLSFSNTNMPGGSSSNATYFLVAKQAGTAGSLLVTTPLFGTGGSLLSTENNGGMQIYIGGVSPDGGASWSGNTPYIQTLVVQSNQITRRANGTQLNVTTFTSAVSANTSNAFISGFFGGGYNYWNGQVYEVLVYNSPLATLAMQQIEGYLAWKWGITLGAAHPYYAVSPGITPDPAGTLTQFGSFGLDTANNLQITATNAIRLTAAVQIPTTLTTSSVTVSTINGSTLTQLITQPFQSTVQGLGTAGYISTATFQSTVAGINYAISQNTVDTVFYLNPGTAAPTYRQMSPTQTTFPQSTLTTSITRNTSNIPIAQFQTDFTVPQVIPDGAWDLNLFAYTAHDRTYIYTSLFARAGVIETLIASSSNATTNIGTSPVQQYTNTLFVPQTIFTSTTGVSLVLKVFANNPVNQDDTLYTFYQGANYSHTHTTFGTVVPDTLFTSTVAGLGTAGYVSTLVNVRMISSLEGYVSSFRTDSLTVGGPTGFVTIQDLTTTTISTGQIVAGAGFISSLQINTLSFGPSGYVIVGDVIANSLSTTRLNTQALYTNNLYVGNVSSQSAILFPGIDGNYRGTAVAEQTTGVGTQELLLYKVSSTTDQIRLQTTGNIVFEAGAAARSWNSTTQLATPTLYIAGSTSNVGVGTAAPATTLDVVGTGRFQVISSFALNVSSINGAAPGGTFNGSTLALSTAIVTTSTLATNSAKTSSLTMYGTLDMLNNPLTNIYSALFAPLYTGINNSNAGGTYTIYTSGTITYAVHSFTSIGTTTFTPLVNIIGAQLLVVGGGGSGGGINIGGGGGAGGLVYATGLTITSSGGPYSIVVGNGGPSVSGSYNTPGNNGGSSSAFGYTGSGGGGGGSDNGTPGGSGGCGGGGGYSSTGAPPGNGTQGFGGGIGSVSSPARAGGGGGMGSAGSNFNSANASWGGNGVVYAITGSNVGYAAGGGGGFNSTGGAPSGGLANGVVIGGYGGYSPNILPTAGAPNTGSGGGGCDVVTNSGAGGSGIVIIAYPLNQYSYNPYTVGTITGDATSNLSIQPVNTLSLVGTTQATGLLAASSFSTTFINATTISTAALTVSSINGAAPWQPSFLTSTVQALTSNISSMIDPTELTSSIVGLGTAGFISTVGLTYAVASTAQGLGTFGYTSTNQLLSTTIGVYGAIGSNIATTVQPQFMSTVAGLGTAGYISTAFTGSTTSLSTAIIATSSLTANVGKFSTLTVCSTLNMSNNPLVNINSALFAPSYSGNPNNNGGGLYTIYTSGSISYAVHAFRTVGTTTFTASATIIGAQILVVGGGGSGGGGASSGGGGAGGLVYATGITIAPATYSIVVGGGGVLTNNPNYNTPGVSGSNTSALGYTGNGGGAGGSDQNHIGANGGCGGGGCGLGAFAGGTGSQGFAGGTAVTGDAGAGGGGMGSIGSVNSGGVGGAGGSGVTYSITGTATGYAAGGGGSSLSGTTPVLGGSANGTVIGGYGGASTVPPTAGAANTGSGGGGQRSPSGFILPGAGGSGIVIIAYPLNQYTYTPYTVGTITGDATSNLSIQPVNNLNIVGITQTSALLAASTFSTTFINATTVSAAALTVSSINGQTFGGPIQSTVIGLGSAGYISTSQLGSTVTNLITRIGAGGGGGTTFVGSTTFLSATQVLFSTQIGYNISSVLGFVSSLQVDELQIGTGFGIIAFGDTNMSSISTLGIAAGLGNFQTINVSSINGALPGTGTGSGSGNFGTVSSLTAIRFFGLTGGFTNTAIAEVSTGIGTQELLLYKVSSISDQIRMQTTGNVIFESGVSARGWPTAPRIATPNLYIAASNSNVGIGTSNPLVTLDVAGTGRFQTLSSLNITAGSINYSVAFV
jgi:uncharacterized membrane protein